MDEPSYENEEPQIRVIDVIDHQQSTGNNSYPHHQRRHCSPTSEQTQDGPAVCCDDDDDDEDDGDPNPGILTWDKRLSPDGASNNNADEASDDEKARRKKLQIDERLSAPNDNDDDDKKVIGVAEMKSVNGVDPGRTRADLSNGSETPKSSDRQTPDGADRDDGGGGGGSGGSIKVHNGNASEDDSGGRRRGGGEAGEGGEIVNGHVAEAVVVNGRSNSLAWRDKEDGVGASEVDADDGDAGASHHLPGHGGDGAAESSVRRLRTDESEEGATPIFGLGTDDSQQSLDEEFNGLDLYGNADR